MNKNKNEFLMILSGSCLILIFSVLFSLNNNTKTVSEDKNVVMDVVEQMGCRCFDYTGEVDWKDTTAIYNGETVVLPKYAFDTDTVSVMGINSERKWIEVDLSEQKLIAHEGDGIFLETKVSTGLPWTPTPTGVFHIWIKLRATKMEGGQGKYYYYLPNVPYVMFFGNEQIPNWKGYGLHGTYWHDDFGTPHSHGCVNLPTAIAKELYYWTTPFLGEKSVVYSNDENPGTMIVIHE